MIEPKELIRALRRSASDNLRCLGCGYEHSCGIHGCRLMKEASDALEASIQEQEERRWIPVTERLPETDDMVLVIASGRPRANITLDNAYELASFNRQEGWIFDMWPDWEDANVTHWMPLPEPPKEENNE